MNQPASPLVGEAGQSTLAGWGRHSVFPAQAGIQYPSAPRGRGRRSEAGWGGPWECGPLARI